VHAGYLGEPRCVLVTVVSGRALDRSTPLGWWGPYALRAHGGGVLNQVLVHYVDFVRATFGELHDPTGTAVTTVPAKPVMHGEPRTGAALDADAEPDGMRPVDADDTVVLQARLRNGAPFALAGSWVVHHGGGQRIEAHGSEGTLVLDGGRLLAGRRGEQLAEVVPGAGGPPDMVEAFAWLAEQLARAVAGGPVDPVHAYPTFEDGLRVQEIVETVLASTKDL
jgi:predicted dehydrogenase